MKRIYRVLNKLMAYLGLGLIGLGLLMYVVRQMSSDNPKNQPTDKINNAQPKASNDQPLQNPTTVPTPYTAHFAVFTNGTFRVFTAAMYHNQDSNVFINSENPNSIVVKKPDITWEYFFNTLPFQLSSNCLITGTAQKFCSDDKTRLRFFVNGTEKPGSVLKNIIHPNDKLLITFGELNTDQISDQLSKLDEISTTKP